MVLHKLSNVTVVAVDGRESPDSLVRSHALNGNDRARGQQILLEAQQHYMAMYRYRRDRERNKRYTYGDQWSDIVCVDGQRMTEEEYIKKQGNVPLKTNLIRRLVRNVIGVYRQQATEPTCIARDRDEQQQAETMSTVLQYNWQMNRMNAINARSLEEYLIGSLIVHRKSYGWRNDRMDCWTDYVQPNNFFIDANMRDFRGWDCSCVGQIHDLSFEELCQNLANNPFEYNRLAEIYKYARDVRGGNVRWEDFGYSDGQAQSDFLMPTDQSRCRVIEVWRKESKPRIRCHDYNNGDIYKIDESEYHTVEAENQKRLEMGQRNGMAVEDIPFIKTEWFMDSYWYYYFLSPFGDILKEGETPYDHKSHPYVFKAYPFIDGEIHSFVADVIDQQRYTNRLITMQDFIIRATAKGVLMIPEDCIPAGMSPEDFADTWAKYNGVIVYKPSKSGHVPQQIANNSTNIGLHEMLSLQLKFFEDISGINGALQGKAAFAGESGSHAQMMAQNAATSLVDILESFNEFVLDASYKDVKNIQQFYDSKRTYNIVGRTGANTVYDPEKIRDVEFDLSIQQSQTTPVYRAMANDMLLELFKANAINVEQLLQAGNFPFADQILQSIQSQKQQLEQGQVPDGISPELMQQAQQGANMQAVQQLQNAVRA